MSEYADQCILNNDMSRCTLHMRVIAQVVLHFMVVVVREGVKFCLRGGGRMGGGATDGLPLFRSLTVSREKLFNSLVVLLLMPQRASEWVNSLEMQAYLLLGWLCGTVFRASGPCIEETVLQPLEPKNTFWLFSCILWCRCWSLWVSCSSPPSEKSSSPSAGLSSLQRCSWCATP